MTDRPSQVFARLSQGITDQRWLELAELYAEDVVVDMPFAAPTPTRLRGREEVRTRFAAAAQGSLSLQARNVVVHETADPEVIVAEFAYQGRVEETGEAFTVPCVFVMRIRGGLIIESRDYIDHIASARAWGELDSLLTALRPQKAQPMEPPSAPDVIPHPAH
jgi:ketosteroid isomerase-like protein